MMAKTNAEKQADWRQRRQQTIEELRQEVERLRNQPPPAAPTISGLYLDNLTTDEYRHLLEELTNMRKKAAEYAATRRELDEALKNNPKLQEEEKRHAEAQLTRRERATAARHAAMEASRPKVGSQMWMVDRSSRDAENLAFQVNIVLIGKDVRVEYPDGTVRALKYRETRWETVDGYLYRTREDAFSFLHGNPFVRPLRDKTIEELRRLRSKHHADRNGNADPLVYQLVMEELDRRRGTPA